jgi:hypothetical protein
MILFGIFLSFVITTFYYLVEATRNGMAKKRWVTAGIVLGPLAFPMFCMSKKMAIRKVRGYHCSFLRA